MQDDLFTAQDELQTMQERHDKVTALAVKWSPHFALVIFISAVFLFCVLWLLYHHSWKMKNIYIYDRNCNISLNISFTFFYMYMYMLTSKKFIWKCKYSCIWQARNYICIIILFKIIDFTSNSLLGLDNWILWNCLCFDYFVN